MITMDPVAPWRVALIEDSAEDRTELRRLLLKGSERRYTFLEAESAAQGIRFVRDHELGPPTCVLLDYYLPDATGDEVLAALLGDDGVLIAPVVVITVGDSAEISRRVLRSGAEDFVGKAWMTAESLSRVVENAVERWVMARELRASEARFRQLAAAVPQAVWMIDAAGKLLYANDLWHAYFGDPGGASATEDWGDAYHPDDRGAMAASAALGAPFQRDCRLRRADGQYRWHQVNAVPIHDAAGRLTFWYGVNTDIDHRKLSEQRLAVEHAVSRILNSAHGLADAAPAILRTLAVGLDMEVCALWLPDDGGRALRCHAVHDSGAPRLGDFVAQTRAMACGPGVGLPGLVWHTRQAERTTSLTWSPRAHTAETAGIAFGVGYPLCAGSAFLGVIEMFSASALPIDEPLVEMLSAMGNEIGQFILRRRAEAAAEGHQARLRLALEASRTGIWSWELATDAVEWTPECYAIHDISPEEFAGTGAAFFQLVHPDDRARVEATVRAAIARHIVYACEFRIVRPDGTSVWVENMGHAEAAADGTPLRMLGTVSDITDRKRVSHELERSEERLARAQRAAHVGTWDWNIVTGEASWTDEAWRVFCGGDSDGGEVSYERWLACLHPDDRARAVETLRAALQTGSYRDEFRVCHRTGEIHWIESVGEVQADEAGQPIRVVGTARDVTERRAADAAIRAALDRAEHAVQLRDQLVSLVSHDLRSPLSVLSMALAVVSARNEDGALLDADTERSLGYMARQVTTMTRMVDELLDVTRLQSGTPLPLDPGDVDLVELCTRVAGDYQGKAHRHRIEVRASSPRVIGTWDAARIERVIDNLLSNAVKYSPAGGTVVVHVAAPAADHAVVAVEDSGIGILPGDRARVFEWFGRGENAKQHKIGGIGLGLAGVKQIVEQHGGTIAVDSEPGKGARFTVRLPTRPPAFRAAPR